MGEKPRHSMIPSTGARTTRRWLGALTLILGLIFLIPSWEHQERLLRRRLQKSPINLEDALGGLDDALGGLDGLDIQKISKEEGIIAAAAAVVLVPVVAFTGLVSLLTGGAVLGEILDQYHLRLPSQLEYTLPTTVELRRLSNIEQDELVNVTEAFYTETLTAAFPEDFKFVKLVYRKEAYDTTAPNFVIEILDSIFGTTRNYGYRWKFEMWVKLNTADAVTLGQLLRAVQDANYANYVTTYLANMPFNILSSTETATYKDRLED